MRIYGMTADNAVSQKIVSYVDPSLVQKHSKLKGEAKVFFDQVMLMHEGSDRNFRPYLQMLGIMKEFTPEEKMPYNISSVNFGQTCPQILYNYSFSDDEIKSLIDAGYYNSNFRVPDIFTTEQFSLPAECNMTIVQPDTSKPISKDNIPLVVVSSDTAYTYDIDGETSGYYDLAKYFKSAIEKYSAPSYSEPADEQEAKMYEDEIEDTIEVCDENPQFAEPDYEQEYEGEPTEEEEPVMGDPGYDPSETAIEDEMYAELLKRSEAKVNKETEAKQNPVPELKPDVEKVVEEINREDDDLDVGDADIGDISDIPGDDVPDDISAGDDDIGFEPDPVFEQPKKPKFPKTPVMPDLTGGPRTDFSDDIPSENEFD